MKLKRGGFTLIELLICVAILIIVAPMTFTLFNNLQKQGVEISGTADAQESTEAIERTLRTEIADATALSIHDDGFSIFPRLYIAHGDRTTIYGIRNGAMVAAADGDTRRVGRLKSWTLAAPAANRIDLTITQEIGEDLAQREITTPMTIVSRVAKTEVTP